MSQRSPTGYDNVDASPEAKGARDEVKNVRTGPAMRFIFSPLKWKNQDY